MKITCTCGHLIPDLTDAQPHKSHLIPDKDWLPVLDTIDGLLADLAAGEIGEDAAAMGVRRVLTGAARAAYRCMNCARLMVEDDTRELRSFIPEAPV